MSVEQIQNLIADAVTAHLGGDSHKAHLYKKPYTKRINALHMPQDYQPPKFNQFDGKGNPKQHIVRLVETCSDAGTEGNRLVKQFVRSLKGIAFDRYTNIASESIDSWRQMKSGFLNCFHSTHHVVSITELTNIRQWNNESAIDYIYLWHALSLKCKEHLSESSTVEMCIQRMDWIYFTPCK